jgi:hypothetical protein
MTSPTPGHWQIQDAKQLKRVNDGAGIAQAFGKPSTAGQARRPPVHIQWDRTRTPVSPERRAAKAGPDTSHG